MAETSPSRQSQEHLKIRELRSKYAHSIDHGAATGEWEDFINLYTEDAVLEYPQATITGHEEIRGFCEEIEDMYEFSMHTVQMPVIDIDDDEATGEWYMLVGYTATDGSEGLVMGSYEDDYRHVDGEWKFSRIKAIISKDTGGFHP
jgi:ketosteroid isomerase-like protein